jgi:SAM-dependent methyltransferase
MEVREYNRAMWDKQVENHNPWTLPVGPEVITAARQGQWSVVLTENKPVPPAWFPEDLRGCEVLCLASGGGQQGPVLAAVGARVTILDNSPRQLEQDRMVAARDGLALTTVEGDMRDLSAFAESSFDMIFHPVSNPFVPEVRPVWQEAYRVLRPGGYLLAGFNNPAWYLFDSELEEKGILEVRFSLPFDSRLLSEEERLRQLGKDAPLEFSHSLEEQIGGQLDAGFHLIGLYEDVENTPVGHYMPAYIAPRAIKPTR